MGRLLRLTPGFHVCVKKLGVAVFPARGTLRTMLDAELPGPLDFVALIPPTLVAWVRRVPACNLWIYYRFNERELSAVALVTSPPIPADD